MRVILAALDDMTLNRLATLADLVIDNTTNVVTVDSVKPTLLDATLHCTATDAGLSRPEATCSPKTLILPARPAKRIFCALSSHLRIYSTNPQAALAERQVALPRVPAKFAAHRAEFPKNAEVPLPPCD